MDLSFSPAEEQFRAECRSWLEANVPRTALPSGDTREGFAAHLEWERTLFDAGYAVVSWPREYGGREASLWEWLIFEEEYYRAGAPSRVSQNGIFLLAPTLFEHGTKEQQDRYLPKMASGEEQWAQGWSEPNAGSDLANLQTRAVLDGDSYVLNGQKVWTSMAHVADWGFFLVRTDPAVAKHKGITFILVDMKTPGITIRPLRQITGEAEFNEVFLENVRVPASNVVGKVNEGWGVAITTLAHERDVLTMIRHISLRTALERLVALSKRTMKDGRPASKDPVLRQKIANLQVAERCLQLNGYRSLTRILQGAHPGPEGSTSKLFWSQVDQDLADVATDIIGPYSQIAAPSPLAPDDGQWEFYALVARGSGIRAGTSEILRNILGERVLGLPKD